MPATDSELFAQDRPDSHWVDTDEEGAVLGRCSLWWNRTPVYGNHRVGVIGHYAANDRWAAERVLNHACQELASHGCTLAVGPMDGNTWRRYRFVTDFGSAPPFFLEPHQPRDWPRHYLENGFRPLAEYFSAVNSDLSIQDPLVERVAAEMKALGVRIRSLDPRQFENDLRSIYSVANVSFRDNLLFMPIEEDEFLTLYRPMQRVIPCDFVFIAKKSDQPVGFIFAVPDLLQAQRGEAIDTMIVKTLAILPGQELAGLGYVLLDCIRSTAVTLGYTRLIHALVRDTEPLRRMTLKSARPMRRYTIYSRELRP